MCTRTIDFKTINLILVSGRQEFRLIISPTHFTLRGFIDDHLSQLERTRVIDCNYHEGSFSSTDRFNVKFIGDDYYDISLDTPLESNEVILNCIQNDQPIDIEVDCDLIVERTFEVSMREFSNEGDSSGVDMPTIPIRGDSNFKFAISTQELYHLAGVAKSNAKSSLTKSNSSITQFNIISNNDNNSCNSSSSYSDELKKLANLGLVGLPVNMMHDYYNSDTESIATSFESENITCKYRSYETESECSFYSNTSSSYPYLSNTVFSKPTNSFNTSNNNTLNEFSEPFECASISIIEPIIPELNKPKTILYKPIPENQLIDNLEPTQQEINLPQTRRLEEDSDYRPTPPPRRMSVLSLESEFKVKCFAPPIQSENSKIPNNILTAEVYNVKFIVPSESGPREVIMECNGNQTVSQIKDNLWRALIQCGFIPPKSREQWSKDNYTLTYAKGDVEYELFDEKQMFQTLSIIRKWKRENLGTGILHLSKKREPSDSEKKFKMMIGYLISIGIYQLELANNDEVQVTRRKFVGVRLKALQERDPISYAMNKQLTHGPLPKSLSFSNCKCRFNTKSGSKVFNIDLESENPDNFLKNNIQSFFPNVDEADSKSYVIRTYDKVSYLYGPESFLMYTYIRESLIKGRVPIDFAVVKAKDPSADEPEVKDASLLLDDSVGLSGTHLELSATTREHHSDIVSMSIFEINKPFRIRFLGVDNLHTFPIDVDTVFIEAALYHGGIPLCPPVYTDETPISPHPRWSKWLTFGLRIKDLPRSARVHLVIYGGKERKVQREPNDQRTEDKISKPTKNIAMHWVNMQLFDHRSILRTSVHRLPLWPSAEPIETEKSKDMYMSYGVKEGIDPSPSGSTAVNPETNKSACLFAELDNYAHPVAYPSFLEENEEVEIPDVDPGDELGELETAIFGDLLRELTEREVKLIEKYKNYCTKFPKALPKYLICLNWGDATKVKQCHYLLKKWSPLTLEVALQLLDYHFADAFVRELAVNRLRKMLNEEIELYLLQLVQVLKFEPYHDSALARFLLEAALESKIVGHYFFWYLRSEMGTHQYEQRFSILLEAYLTGCGSDMIESFRKQVEFVTDIVKCSKGIKEDVEKSEKKKQHAAIVTHYTSKINLPDIFSPVFDPCLLVGDLDYSKIKVMDSKKKPIWLEFKNKDSCNPSDLIKLIVKSGDDLRQDMLTLQMIRIMEKIWLQHGLNLHLIPYGCIATGFEEGVIEVVQHAKTVCKIQKDANVSFTAFRSEVLLNWLLDQNQLPSDLETARENFMLSCAGYCVATYILGIGDRHNDNIMVTEDGNLFHIDFGHFLGNHKKKLGIDREPVPFILTPDFVQVLKGDSKDIDLYDKFLDIATKAYLIIRQHSNLFITLFSMMKCTGIPELTSIKDIEYLQSVMVPKATTEEAIVHFREKVKESINNSLAVQINWQIHIKVH